MFCKDCAKKISENSRFCSFCGGKQDTHKIFDSPHLVLSHQKTQKVDGVIGDYISKRNAGFYLIWLLLHLILLLTNWKASVYSNQYFYPFGKGASIEDYDLTEFLLYTIFPLLVFVIIKLLTVPKQIQLQNLQLKYDLTFEKDTRPTVVGIIILIIQLILLFSIINEDNYGNERKIEESIEIINKASNQTIIILSIASIILRIIVATWMLKIARNLNRNIMGWGLFAFFMPVISLIFIGQKRKFKIDV